jgi:hypothetical protein
VTDANSYLRPNKALLGGLGEYARDELAAAAHADLLEDRFQVVLHGLPPVAPVDIALLKRVSERYNAEIIGPPLSA